MEHHIGSAWINRSDFATVPNRTVMRAKFIDLAPRPMLKRFLLHCSPSLSNWAFRKIHKKRPKLHSFLPRVKIAERHRIFRVLLFVSVPPGIPTIEWRRSQNVIFRRSKDAGSPLKTFHLDASECTRCPLYPRIYLVRDPHCPSRKRQQCKHSNVLNYSTISLHSKSDV
jgi:hypothetical protein